MKEHILKYFILTFFSIIGLHLGAVSQAAATPLLLNFEIVDPLEGSYNETHFSYQIDLASPFWSSVQGSDPFDQNAFKYNIEFFDADPILGILPDLIMSTGQTIHDWESGYTHFSNSTYSFDFSAGHTYIEQIIDVVNGGHAWFFSGFYAESLGFTAENYPSDPIPGVRLYSTTSVPEPTTILLFATGLVGMTWIRHRRK